jgi:sulfur carrier protein ThiS
METGEKTAARIRLGATLRAFVPDYRPAQGLEVELPSPTSAADLAERLGLPLGEIRLVLLNGRRVPPSALVNGGDRVGFFPALGGG